MGLPGRRLFCGDQSLRDARRFPLPGGPLPSQRHRSHPGLGPRPFSEGRLCPCPVRRYGPLRARRPPQGRTPRLVDAHLQLRPQRGRASSFQRALLAEGNAHRRPAGGRGCLDALPRLLAHRMDTQPIRRSREPGGDRVLAGAECRHARRIPRHASHRRGVDVVAAGDASDVPRRPRLRHQVEHGVDERHPALHVEGGHPPAVSSRSAHVQHVVLLSRRTSCCRSHTTKSSTARVPC